MKKKVEIFVEYLRSEFATESNSLRKDCLATLLSYLIDENYEENLNSVDAWSALLLICKTFDENKAEVYLQQGDVDSFTEQTEKAEVYNTLIEKLQTICNTNE